MNQRYNSLNDFLKVRFKERVYKIAVDANLGCPNFDGTIGKDGCSFCNLATLEPVITKGASSSFLTSHNIQDQVKFGIEYGRKRHNAKKFIAHFQSGSNTYAPLARLESVWSESIEHPDIVGLAISTRPDTLSKACVELIHEFSKRTFVWVELGLQSANDSTLKAINRGHSVNCFLEAYDWLREYEIPTCAHVVLGLPGEEIEEFRETASFLNKHELWGVKIHNLHVLKDTLLEKKYADGKIKLPTLNEYSFWVRDFLEHLSERIIIHRFNSHSPRRFTIAPDWSINKLATLNAVHEELERHDSRQGKLVL
ncbi:MAG: TIGR01212 family radical SAM protein [Pseudomonadota bacterium]